MSTSDTIALASAIGTGAGVVVGALIGVPSALFARRAAKAGEDSAETGKVSAKAALESAEAARVSAKEAAALTAIEADRRAEERERWHAELGPALPAEIVTELRDGRAAKSLFGAIIIPGQHSYRVQAHAHLDSGGWTGISFRGTSTLRPDRPHEFEIELWPEGSTKPKTKEIRFRFWPPLEPDGVDVWTCPCGRPTGESLDGPGHWERTVLVRYDHYDVGKTIW